MSYAGFIPVHRYPALILNADFRPLSYYPLSLWSWQETVKAVFLDRVSIVSEYEREVHSPSLAMRLPSVVSLKAYVRQERRRPAFTRFNVFLRDRFTCQFCGRRPPAEGLTFDHVVPRSRGGVSSWTNVVTACRSCNERKGCRTPSESGMPLLRPPRSPGSTLLRENGRAFPPRHLHRSWMDFLYWDSELES